MTDPAHEVITVKIALTRRDAEAFVAWVEREGVNLTTYTGEGITLVNVMTAIRDALGKTSQDAPPA
jgi:hypothetical protein